VLGRLAERHRDRINNIFNPNQNGGIAPMNVNDGQPPMDSSAPAAMIKPSSNNEKEKKMRLGLGLGALNIGINLPNLLLNPRPKNNRNDPSPTTTAPLPPVRLYATKLTFSALSVCSQSMQITF
jgi:hypothetical protein